MKMKKFPKNLGEIIGVNWKIVTPSSRSCWNVVETADSGAHFEVTVRVLVTISNPTFNGLQNCFIWQLHLSKTNEGLGDLSDYNMAMFVLNSTKKCTGQLKREMGFELSQKGWLRKINYPHIHSPRNGGDPEFFFFFNWTDWRNLLLITFQSNHRKMTLFDQSYWNVAVPTRQ
jgi:hypothetical protein